MSTVESQVDSSFSVAVERAAKQHNIDNRRKIDTWTGSQIGHCQRAAYFDRLFLDWTTPSEGNSVLRMMIGTAIHEIAQGLLADYMPRGALKVESEAELYDKELDLKGHYDNMWTLPDFSRVFDIKSQQERAFWWMKKKQEGYTNKDGTVIPPTPISEQKKDHFLQVSSYLLLLKRAGTPAKYGTIVYWSTDTSTKTEVDVYLTDEREQAVIDWCAEMKGYWERKELPPCTCADLWNGAGVGYCNYGDLNSLDSKGEVTKCCSADLWKGTK